MATFSYTTLSAKGAATIDAPDRSTEGGRSGQLGSPPTPPPVRTGASFADAAAEYLRFAEEDRGCKKR